MQSETQLLTALQDIQSFLATQQMEQALALTEDLLSLWPERGEGYFCLALISYYYDQVGEALAAAEKALAQDDQVKEYAILMEGLCGQAGRLNDALYYAKLSVSLPDNPLLKAMIPPVLHTFMAALEQEDRDHGHLIQAMLAFNLRKFQDVIEHCRLEIKVHPDNAELYALMGRAMIEVGDFDQAILALRAVLQLQGDTDRRVHIHLAHAFARAGQVEEAFNTLDDALDADGGADTEILAGAVRVYSMLGARGRARAGALTAERTAQAGAEPVAFPAEPAEEGVIRIGILSDRLYDSPQGQAVQALVNTLNPKRFRISLYAQNILKDSLSDDLKNMAADWREVHEIDDKTLSLIMSRDGNDVLLDMIGYGEGERLSLLAMRPGGARYGWWSEPGGAQVPGHDGVLTAPDMAASVPGDLKDVSLQGALLFFKPPSGFASPAPPQADEAPVFGARLDGGVIDDDLLDDFKALLSAFPGSVVRLGLIKAVSQNLLAALQERLADPVLADRIALHVPGDAPEQPGVFFNTVDFFLSAGGDRWLKDTLDALWMGVPCLAVAGRREDDRMTRHLLAQAGFDGQIAAQGGAALAALARSLWSERDTAQDRLVRRQAVLDRPLSDIQAFAQGMGLTLDAVWQERQSNGMGESA